MYDIYLTDKEDCKKAMATPKYRDILKKVINDWKEIEMTIEPTDSQGYSYDGIAVYNGKEYYFSYNCGDCDIRPFLNEKEEIALQIYETIMNQK